MSWHETVTLCYELGGRAMSDLREENGSQHLIAGILQHRLDHRYGHHRWPQPDPDLEYEGEVVQWAWQHAPCAEVKRRNAFRTPEPCGHMVRLSQEEAARHVNGETVEVYCSWCSHESSEGWCRVKLDRHDLVIDILLAVGLLLAGIAIGMTIAYNVWTETPLELCRQDLPRSTCSVLFDGEAE